MKYSQIVCCLLATVMGTLFAQTSSRYSATVHAESQLIPYRDGKAPTARGGLLGMEFSYQQSPHLSYVGGLAYGRLSGLRKIRILEERFASNGRLDVINHTIIVRGLTHLRYHLGIRFNRNADGVYGTVRLLVHQALRVVGIENQRRRDIRGVVSSYTTGTLRVNAGGAGWSGGSDRPADYVAKQFSAATNLEIGYRWTSGLAVYTGFSNDLTPRFRSDFVNSSRLIQYAIGVRCQLSKR